jgi:hypothetical protein
LGSHDPEEVIMPGLRGEQDIIDAFKGLEYVPGSKRKRVDPTANAFKPTVTESTGWDENPIRKMLNGQETEVFTIGALAAALGKQIVTVRLWERKGFIPLAPYRLRSKTLNGKKTGGNRVYTRPLIEAAIDEFARRGLIGSARIEWSQHEDLTDALVRRWKELTQQKSQS